MRKNRKGGGPAKRWPGFDNSPGDREREGFETYALSFSYGQRHSWELECARSRVNVRASKIIGSRQIDLRVFGGSALTADISVPKGARSRKCRTRFR